MVADPFGIEELDNYAEILAWAIRSARPLPIKNSDIIVIKYDMDAVGLAEAVYVRLMREHLNPVPVCSMTARMEQEKYLDSSMGQLLFHPPGVRELMEKAAGVIRIYAPESMGHLARLLPETLLASTSKHGELRKTVSRRIRLGELGVTGCVYPTKALAKVCGMSYEEYADRLMSACGIISADPAGDWNRRRKQVGEVVSWLNSLKAMAFRVESETVDLTVQLGDMRRFVGVTGRNIPGTEIYVTPDWRGVSGVFTSSLPLLLNGRVVSGIRLEFKNGYMTSFKAERGGSYLGSILNGVPGAMKVGEFSLSDKRFSRIDRYMGHVLLDENHGGEFGNCHIALGGGCPETFAGPGYELTDKSKEGLGFNMSTVHLDVVNTEPKRVTAYLLGGERKLVYENGEFIL